MAYPDLCQSASSTRVDSTVVETDQAEDGTVRARSFFSQRTYTFQVVHEVLSRADYDTLMTWIDANFATVFDFTWRADNVVYECVMNVMPTITPVVYNRFTVNVGLLGTPKP